MAKLKVLWSHICSLGTRRLPGEEYDDPREDNVEARVSLGLVEVIEGGSDEVLEKQLKVADEVEKRSKRSDAAAVKKAEEDAEAAEKRAEAKKAEEDAAAAAALLNA